jgi:hypothetical protein
LGRWGLVPASEAGLAVGPPPGSRLGANDFFVSWKNIFFFFIKVIQIF